MPDCVDPSLKGDVYACESPPTDNPNILCFQPEEDPGCDPEQISNGAIDGKGWVCIDRTATAWKEGDDSYRFSAASPSTASSVPPTSS